MPQRKITVTRNTLETRIEATVNLDGTGISRFHTGLPFLDHMLDQVARHGMMDIDVQADGDLHIDAHHTVEDIGIALGQAIVQALGDKKGIR
ncbi:MAG: imidazoleglycerol-phosphate dehydratase, partial [Gammaproteobacteria bacterium]